MPTYWSLFEIWKWVRNFHFLSLIVVIAFLLRYYRRTLLLNNQTRTILWENIIKSLIFFAQFLFFGLISLKILLFIVWVRCATIESLYLWDHNIVLRILREIRGKGRRFFFIASSWCLWILLYLGSRQCCTLMLESPSRFHNSLIIALIFGIFSIFANNNVAL